MTSARYRRNFARTMRTVLCCSATLAFAAAPQRVSAQHTTNVPALRVLAEEAAQHERAAREEAEAWALENGWPVRQTIPGGRTMEIKSLDERGRPVYRITYNLNAADSVSTDEVWPGGSAGLNLNGSGVLLGIWDGGRVRTTHQEFGGRAVQRDGAVELNYHSTHVAGTMVAAGVDPAAKGMSFTAAIDCRDWDSDLSEMSTAAVAGLRLSNHSYGAVVGWEYFDIPELWTGWIWLGDTCVDDQEDYRFGFYDQGARDLDQLAFNAPYYLVCWAAGNDRNDVFPGEEYLYWPCNGDADTSTAPRESDGGADGYDCIPPDGIAKNILTVGAVADVPGGYSTPPSVQMSSFSSWGPADDGRIKPDICGNGIQLYSTWDTGDADYDSISGTSMATPNVTGSLGLLVQHWRNTHTGGDMRAATLKALVIHTADECGASPGPDYAFGWGLLNTRKATDVVTQDASQPMVISEQTLQSGQQYELSIVTQNSQELRATICWTDRAGSVLSPQLNPRAPRLVNDLDMRIETNPPGQTYDPWVLNPDAPANAASTGDNDVDNVEQVVVSNPGSAAYKLIISHEGALTGGSQAFSLILTGFASATGAEDCNTNGVDDAVDIVAGTSADCNGNGVPDECDIAADTSDDINGNNVPDECDPDCNANDIPDDMETDSDGDDVIDDCDNCPNVANPDQEESDSDGSGDACDPCPYDPLDDEDADTVCGDVDNCPITFNPVQADLDGDGAGDACDPCSSDRDKVLPGVCGCGMPDADTDGDGVCDCHDDCPIDPYKRDPGLCGCGVNDFDTDGDNVPDLCTDECPHDPAKSLPGACGCGVPDTDGDADGHADCKDNCPTKWNPDQADSDGDGVGDACAPERPQLQVETDQPSTPEPPQLEMQIPCSVAAVAPAAVLALWALGMTKLARQRKLRVPPRRL